MVDKNKADTSEWGRVYIANLFTHRLWQIENMLFTCTSFVFVCSKTSV